MEILVALVLIGLLVGALVPTLMNQLNRADPNRVHEDLEAVSTGAKTFRLDVSRWPGDAEDLTAEPLTTAASGDSILGGGLYTAALAGRWEGPYLEIGTIPTTGLPTGFGGTIQNRFAQTTWNGSTYLTLRVANVSEANAKLVSTRIESDSMVTNDATGGRVRWATGDTLIYLATPTP